MYFSSSVIISSWLHLLTKDSSGSLWGAKSTLSRSLPARPVDLSGEMGCLPLLVQFSKISTERGRKETISYFYLVINPRKSATYFRK